MLPASSAPPTGPDRGRWARLPSSEKIAIVSAVLTAVGLVLAAAAWLRPQSPAGSGAAPPTPLRPAPSVTAAAAAPPGTAVTPPGTTGPTGSSAAPRRRYLESIAPEQGRVTRLPKQLAGRPEASHAQVLACPRNGTAEPVREIVYPVQRLYSTLTATVSGWAPTTDPLTTELTVFTGVPAVDGTLTRTRQELRRMRLHEPGQAITVDIEGATQLVLRVDCDFPGGVVVLSDAVLTS